MTHLVYGRWHEPCEVLAGLGERLEAAADIDRLVNAALAELTTGLDLRDVTVSGPDGDLVAGTVAAVGPAPAAGPASACPVPGTAAAAGAASIPVQAYGLIVGSLSYRTPGRPLSTSEQRLVRDLARQLGGALPARCSARTCNEPGNAWCWRARRNGAVCGETCTTASGRLWPG